MKQKIFLVMASMILAGCGGAPSSSSSSPVPSSESSSSAEPSSSSSIEPSSSSSESSSSSKPKEDVISLFDAESRFFLLDGDPEGSPILKTYSHKYHPGIPYIDMAEFVPIYTKFDKDLQKREYAIEEGGTFFVSRANQSGVRFDCDKQTVTIVDGDAFYGDFGTVNNGISGDVCAGVNIVHPSTKTKTIKKSESRTVDLGQYRLDIVSEKGHLYVPFGVASHFLLEPYFCGAVYSGRDFYQSKYFLKNFNVVRARSRGGSFSWNSDSGDGGGTGLTENVLLMKPVAKAEGDTYTFQGETNKKISATLHLKSDGTVEVDSRLAGLMALDGQWKKEGEILSINFTTLKGDTVPMQIDLSERTYYNIGERSEELAQYNYKLLCLLFDELYGLKSYRGITSFDQYFEAKGFKSGLTSKNTTVYERALSKFLFFDIDDLHTTFACSSLTGPGDYTPASDPTDTYFGPRDKAIGEWRAKINNQYSQAVTEGKVDGPLTIRGSTAVIHYSDYMFAYKEEGYAKYAAPEGKTVNEVAATNFGVSFFRGWATCMNEILKHKEVKNIVFDVTENRGGYIYNLPIFSAIMSDDPRVVQFNFQTGGITEFHYDVDLNGDGVFGGEGDTFKGKYNFAVLTSPASFSAGNITPSLAKSYGFAKVIGLPSAGGPCPVALRMDSFGYTFRTSAQLHYPLIQNGEYQSNDAGVPVDIRVEAEDFFNVQKLDTILNAAFGSA